MNTDWDDAPDYLHIKKKPGPWRMVAILGVGSAITWGVIALFAKPIVINVDQLKQAIHVDGKPLFSQQPAAQPYSEPEEPISLPSIPIDPLAQRVAYEPVSQPQQHASAPAFAPTTGADQSTTANAARPPNSTFMNSAEPGVPAMKVTAKRIVIV